MLIPISQDTSIKHFFNFTNVASNFNSSYKSLTTKHVIRENVSDEIKITAVRLSNSNKPLKFIMELIEKNNTTNNSNNKNSIRQRHQR